MAFARPHRAALGGGAPALVEFVNQPPPFGRVALAVAALRGQRALYSRHSRAFSLIPAADLAEAQLLLSLFTRDIAGKSIADSIILSSECLASARARKLLFICNISSWSRRRRTLRKGVIAGPLPSRRRPRRVPSPARRRWRIIRSGAG